jgi:methanogenic corrinoid protein MtbC1
VTAATTHDLPAARALAAEYLSQTRSTTAVVTDLLSAAHEYVSRRWRFGKATAEDEHNVARAIAEVNDAVRRDGPHAGSGAPQALLATLDPEQHSLGLKLVATALIEDGWDAVMAVGIRRPDLVDAVSSGRFRAVLLSSTHLSNLGERILTSTVHSLMALGKPVIVGGQAFLRNPALAGEVGATAVAFDPRTAMVIARRFRVPEVRRRRGARARASLILEQPVSL